MKVKVGELMNTLINDVIWGIPLLLFLILTSIYLSIKTNFIQIKYIKRIPKLLFEKNNQEGSVSSFSTTMLLLGSHIGVGNIIGVSIAIMYGGPGAIFWMWITALLCSVLAFFENTLGQLYKVKINNTHKGGPAYYILYGLNSKVYATVVALVLFISVGLLMPLVQTSAIITSVHNSFHVSKMIIAILLAGIVAYILFGKGNRLLNVINVCVPVMAILYICISLIIILMNFSQIDETFILIINSALNKQSYYGGLIGTAFSYGMRRGAFSNESGMGTTPNISSQSDVDHPVKQGIISSFCVFIDTILVCSLTAFMILITNKYNVLMSKSYLIKGVKGDYNLFLGEAINTLTSSNGIFIFTMFIFVFAFTSVFGSFVNAQSNLYFIFKNSPLLNSFVWIYKVVFVGLVLITGSINTDASWLMADLGLGLIGWVNLIAIILLSNKVFDSIRDYQVKYK